MPAVDAIITPLVMVTAAGIVALPLLAIVLGERLLHRRRVPAWLGAAVALAGGVVLGYGWLVSGAAPPLRVVVVVGTVVAVAVFAATGRLGLAGWLLIIAGLPTLAYGGAAVADIASSSARFDADEAIPTLVVAAATALVGVALVAYQRIHDARHPRPPQPPEPSRGPQKRRWDALAREVIRTDRVFSLPPLAGVFGALIAAQLTASIAHGRSTFEGAVIAAAGIIVATLAVIGGFALVRSTASRRALEAFVWISERELARLSAIAGRPVAARPGALRRYVRDQPERPDDRWFRVEMLVSAGRLDEARQMAERMPDWTPFERVERVAAIAFLDWLGGGTADDRPLAEAVAAVLPADGPDRLTAEVILAGHRARVRIGDGDPDPVQPLVEVRDRLGRHADGALVSYARRIAPAGLPIAIALVAIALVLDSLAVG